MPASKYLKLPPCPYCKHDQTRCTVTTYTQDLSTIVRHRRCNRCNHSFWTQQPFEQPIDPVTTRVRVLTWGKKALDYRSARASKVIIEPIE